MLSSVREIAPESPQDAFIILCLQIQLELGKKLAGRERAKNKRLAKRYGTRLSGGLFNFLSGDQQAEIASEPASQNALRALLFHEGRRNKPNHYTETHGRNKGTTRGRSRICGKT